MLNALMRLEPCVRLLYDFLGARGSVPQNERRMHAVVDADNDAGANLGKLIEHSFDVLGYDVKAFWSDDHVLLAAQIIQAPVFVDSSEVAGMQPSLCVSCSRDARAAYQDLAVLGDPHFLPWNEFS